MKSDENIIYLIMISRKTRQVAFESSPHCQNQEKMRYDQADSLEEASVVAAEMIRKWSL